jgi:hypothetical protein
MVNETSHAVSTGTLLPWMMALSYLDEEFQPLVNVFVDMDTRTQSNIEIDQGFGTKKNYKETTFLIPYSRMSSTIPFLTPALIISVDNLTAPFVRSSHSRCTSGLRISIAE